MSKEGKFLVFCLECCRAAKGMLGRVVSEFFSKYGLFDYVVRYFESLHTTGVNYIIADLDSYVATHQNRMNYVLIRKDEIHDREM